MGLQHQCWQTLSVTKVCHRVMGECWHRASASWCWSQCLSKDEFHPQWYGFWGWKEGRTGREMGESNLKEVRLVKTFFARYYPLYWAENVLKVHGSSQLCISKIASVIKKPIVAKKQQPDGLKSPWEKEIFAPFPWGNLWQPLQGHYSDLCFGALAQDVLVWCSRDFYVLKHTKGLTTVEQLLGKKALCHYAIIVE